MEVGVAIKKHHGDLCHDGIIMWFDCFNVSIQVVLYCNAVLRDVTLGCWVKSTVLFLTLHLSLQ